MFRTRTGRGHLGGPSELGLSLSLTAAPDLLSLDGAAHAMIEILARDQHGRAVSNVALFLQIETARGFEDFGTALGAPGRHRFGRTRRCDLHRTAADDLRPRCRQR